MAAPVPSAAPSFAADGTAAAFAPAGASAPAVVAQYAPMGAQVDSMLMPAHPQQQVMHGGVAQHVAVPAGPPAAAARPAPTPRAKKAKLEATANAAAAAAASSGSSFSALMAAAAPPALPASPSASVGKKASVPAGEVRSAYVQRMSTFWQDQLAETQSQLTSTIARRELVHCERECSWLSC